MFNEPDLKDHLVALWKYFSELRTGQYVLQTATLAEACKLQERAEAMSLSPELHTSNCPPRAEAEGYIATQLERGVTYPALASAVSGPREFRLIAGRPTLMSPCAATIEQRNGRAGRTKAGVAVNLEQTIEMPSAPHPSFGHTGPVYGPPLANL